jgi:hypothetical protein
MRLRALIAEIEEELRPQYADEPILVARRP